MQDRPTRPHPSPPHSRRRHNPATAGRCGGREAGNLAASGYVVARRKATVAARSRQGIEIFIDEGMTVTDGQIVARLDSVLAEKDYELAQSRAEAADAAIAAITADLQDATRIMSRVQTLSQKNFATRPIYQGAGACRLCSRRNCARCSAVRDAR